MDHYLMNEIIKDYQNGMRVLDIMKKHHTTNIYNHIPKDMRRGRGNKDQIDKGKLIAYYLEPQSIEKVAKQFKTSRSYVKVILKDAGVRIRR